MCLAQGVWKGNFFRSWKPSRKAGKDFLGPETNPGIGIPQDTRYNKVGRKRGTQWNSEVSELVGSTHLILHILGLRSSESPSCTQTYLHITALCAYLSRRLERA